MAVLGAGHAAWDPRSPCPAGGKLHKSRVCVLGWGWHRAGPGEHRSLQTSRGPQRGRDQHTPRCLCSQGAGAGGSPCESRTRKDVQGDKTKSILGSLRGEMKKVEAQIAGLQVSEEPERPPGRGLLSGGLELGRRHSRGRTQGFQTSASKRVCVWLSVCPCRSRKDECLPLMSPRAQGSGRDGRRGFRGVGYGSPDLVPRPAGVT